MKVSLIVTTYNWSEALALCLESIRFQTMLPDEVIIADDGSTIETKNLIEKFIKNNKKLNITHSWQEDKGFRLAASRNLAISKSKAEYIIVVDGDMILDKNFVNDHIINAKKGIYIQGSRVLLSPKFSKKILSQSKFEKPSFFNSTMKNKINSLRVPLLTNIISKITTQKLSGIKGCNFSCFKSDIYLVNGFNEEFNMWGREDSEFVQRLYNSGIKRINLKFSGIQYHIYHKEGKAESTVDKILKNTIIKKLKYCKNGIDKYLEVKNNE